MCNVSSGSAYKPSTMRQTQVIVIPSAPEFTESFVTFDSLITTLNQARRNARDYVTDTMLHEQRDHDDDDDDDSDSNNSNDWSVAINCAHLHPSFGDRTPVQQMQDLRDEEAAGEVDVNYQEYKRVRLAARRSPYPTVVIEVRAAPAPDFSSSSSSPTTTATTTQSLSAAAAASRQEGAVSLSDIQKLEALFGKTAHIKDSTADDAFWGAVGSSIQEVTAVTPIKLAQHWIAEKEGDKAVTPPATTITAFTTSGTAAVDEAYEFVFTNIAMLQEQFELTPRCHQLYLVLPNFLSAAATSFEKFATEVSKLVACLPSLNGKVAVTTYHPEHVDASRRSPTPILVLAWNDDSNDEHPLQ